MDGHEKRSTEGKAEPFLFVNFQGFLIGLEQLSQCQIRTLACPRRWCQFSYYAAVSRGILEKKRNHRYSREWR